MKCVMLEMRCNISNTRDSVSSRYPNIEKRIENTTRSELFKTKFEVFGISDKTLFDRSSQSKQKLEGEVKSSKSMLIKTGGAFHLVKNSENSGSGLNGKRFFGSTDRKIPRKSGTTGTTF